eukprot:CAMPEP_0119136128 /NCGR_PEP_ID=MMETSP1310-20130426/20791_1 /TAXON_ID=464262 /ORGANISM="Genus nov. species nov., Strain RCC2339" /LENGTH=133 /DNA_ID=CAMNT_0007127093 /DNA_START=29 /DNA_END=426 /DNA_ORIENTATION=-
MRGIINWALIDRLSASGEEREVAQVPQVGELDVGQLDVAEAVEDAGVGVARSAAARGVQRGPVPGVEQALRAAPADVVPVGVVAQVVLRQVARPGPRHGLQVGGAPARPAALTRSAPGVLPHPAGLGAPRQRR